MKKALLVVDLQNDFLPGGALAISTGDQVIPVVNRLMDQRWDVIVASQDYHPRGHSSFAATHGMRPGDIIEVGGVQQVLWPIHCIQGSWGADFPPTLHTQKFNKIFLKGVDVGIDSYSAFFDNEKKRSTGLHEYLQEKGISQVYLVGLATDYCVKYSALDALELGYQTFVFADGCRGVELNEGDSQEALMEIQIKGGRLLSSEIIDTV